MEGTKTVVIRFKENADEARESRNRLAFTAEYVVFVVRDEMIKEGGDGVFMARKRNTSVRQVGKYKAEWKVKNKGTSEVTELILMAGPSRYELLTQYIPEKRGNGIRF